MKSWLRKNYHWIIAGVVLLQLAICGGSDNNLSSLHLIPVTEFLGISRTEYALAFTLRSCIAMVMTFCSGMVFKRFGYKKVVLWATLMYIAGYSVLATMNSVVMLAIGTSLLGMGATFCGTSGANHVVSAWFRKYRGTVLGLITAATGIGGSLLCQGQTWAMGAFSWRGSYLLCLGLLVGVFLLMLPTIRNDPKELELTPYGQDAAPGKEKKHRMQEAVFAGKEMKQLWRSLSFYLMLGCILLASFGMYIVFYSIVPYLSDLGYTKEQAGNLQSIALLLLSATKLLAGWFSDRVSAKWVNLGCLGLGIAGTILFIMADSMTVATLAVVLFSCYLPLGTVMVPLLALPLFGYRAQAQYTGVFLSMTYIATTSSNLLTNMIYDAVGSYVPAYQLALGCSVAAAVLFLLLYRTSQKENTEGN